MLIEAYVINKINDYSFECLVALNNFFTRQQIFNLCPINKKQNHLNIDDIVDRAIFIWKNPIHKHLTSYFGKIIYVRNNKVYVINQGIEEIYKKIE
jgi:hypothetical protein